MSLILLCAGIYTVCRSMAPRNMYTSLSAGLFRKHFSTLEKLNTVELAYEKEEGTQKDESILICHGWVGSKQNWRTVSRKLAEKTQIPSYNIDLRNHGASPHVTPHDYYNMVADVVKFIDKHNLKNTTVIGHSMGGKVAMALALARPDLVRRLVVGDISPRIVTMWKKFYDLVDGMIEVRNSNVRSRREADAILTKVEARPEIRQYVLTNAKIEDGRLKFTIPIELIKNCLPEIGDFPYESKDGVVFEKPTTVIKAINSPFLSYDDFPLIKEFFPNSELHTSQTGHFMYMEKPDDFVDLVSRNVEKDRLK